MALVDSIVVRFIWLDGYNIFISALELFFVLNVVFFLTCNPQRVLGTALVGGYVTIFFHLVFLVFVSGSAHLVTLYILI